MNSSKPVSRFPVLSEYLYLSQHAVCEVGAGQKFNLSSQIQTFLRCLNNSLCGAAAYQLGNTSSRTIIEVKQRRARLVLGWETVQV